jgi:hypothetical protein
MELGARRVRVELWLLCVESFGRRNSVAMNLGRAIVTYSHFHLFTLFSQKLHFISLDFYSETFRVFPWQSFGL